ncbi:MAG TPA: hypothetical protein VGN00_09390 [Puia sp.]|jgi:hypothetical protein
MKPAEIIKELQAIRALNAESLQRTSRLEEELAPVQAPARPKGLTPTQRAIMRRNKRILR